MSTDTTLPTIIGRAQSGDAGAISEIYKLYAGQILRFLYSRLNEQETAKDLTQEVFIRVIKGIHGLEYRGEKSFVGWLYTIANNVLIGHVRRSHVAQTPLEDDAELVDPRGQEGVFAVFDRVALAQAIQTLTADQRQVLTLRFFADMTNAEIARLLRRSEGAVKALQHRALQSLQQVMAQDGDDHQVLPHTRPSSAPAAQQQEPLKVREHGALERTLNGGLSLT
jgi:RNA polymerase sigma-70 factor, ECF subfamily